MIISDVKQQRKQRRFSKTLWRKIAIAGVILLGIIWAIVAFIQQENRIFPGKVVCDAEKVEGNFFISDGVKFKNGKTQSKDWAFSGKYSSKISKYHKYGITYSVHNPKGGERYQARTWVRRPKGSDGILIATSPDGNTLRVLCDTPKYTQLEWDLFEIEVVVPNNYEFDRIDFYVYTNEKTLYFDDFTIEKLKSRSEYKADVLNLNIPNKWMQKLRDKRKQAIGMGLLITEDDDWVEGEIILGKDQKADVELRLKGDWLDHLKTDKWSFRIKVGGEDAWKRMKTFSIQQPGARNFLDEWIFHRLLEKIDVLTPRYDFIEVNQNGQYKGVYAYEEHFDKQLVEYKKRREGPIIKFTEDLLWQNVNREIQMYTDAEGVYNRQFTDAATTGQIVPFKQKKTIKSATLMKQFGEAQKLMQQYRYGQKRAEDIFDINAMAKYFAAVDLMAAYHGVIWHNQRFYYNPVTSKLEPIGFDGYSQGHDMSWGKKTFIGEYSFNQQNEINREALLELLFKNEKFMEKYTGYLYKYSSRPFFDEFVKSVEGDISDREALLQREYPDYKFDYDKFFTNARNIRAVIEPYKDESVQAYTESSTDKVKKLKVTNFHALPLKVLGFGTSAKNLVDTLEKPPLLESNIVRKLPVFLELMTKPNMKYIFYELPGKDSIYTSPIFSWKAPMGETIVQGIFKKSTTTTTAAYEVVGKSMLFKKGKHTITEDIIVPEGYQVIFPAGLELNFIKKAKFLSKSAVTMIGRENAPIVIKSTDFSANGFSVIQAESPSKMAYVTFDGFNTLVTEGWNLTGAVTFYESEINIKNCRFIKNKCEDGLNIVRCKFDINGLTIGETFSDGLDIDFGEGSIKNAYFYKTGNDGMDFSGSEIAIDNVIIKNAGDKGISVGEESTVFVQKVEIDGANIGVASKDLSKLFVKFIDLKNCNQGFIAFQKKPEYGGAKIVIYDYKSEEIRFLHKIQVGSTLELKGKIVDNS